MKEKLEKLLENSYSPYYKYNVSSIVITKDGKEFNGVNIETSSPASGSCAERVALYSAISSGYKKGDFKEIHIMSRNLGFPCFICRQAINDFCDDDTLIISYNLTGESSSIYAKDLCPFPFDESDLKQ